MDRQNIKKEAIIAEYLAGGTTYRKLSAKYGITFQSIHQWVQTFFCNLTNQIKKTK